MIWKHRLLKRRLQALLPMAFFALLCLYALWPWLPFGRDVASPRTVVFYGFSILDDVMTDAIFPAFQEEWQLRSGEQVEFIGSFAGSGTVTNQIIMGVPAHLALLSLELDAQRLADAGVIAPESWRHLPYAGVVNRTPFIILVRPGNPRDIGDLADLARPGVGVVHPDPLTSGGANWAIVAEYGAGVRQSSGQLKGGHDLLLGIWRNVVAQAASARAARTQFENGFGDALITYEQEVLWDRTRGRLRGEIVYPQSTILSEHTLVVIDNHIAPDYRELMDAFVAFLWSDRAQRLFVEYGFRSVDESLNEANPAFGAIADPFLIDDFGGWARAKEEIVDGVWKDQVLQELGR
ncbi:MAG TPA: substrate-binding domain-containing protein [Anaerolineae bacterium]|nr:substrate-binding domain-containing protein [Anaerolineae bacterium]